MVVVLASVILLIMLILGFQKLQHFSKAKMSLTPIISPQDDGTIIQDIQVAEPEPSTPSPSSPKTMEDSQIHYDVFLSFRGEDTRKGFTSHLYEGLDQQGICTFIDSEGLEKGEKIKRLLRYIEKSKVCIPIFSKGYADSQWCLKELAKIVECKKKVIPVFFDVDPSDVKNQSGPFASSFRKHESNGELKQEEVRKWKEAMTMIGSTSGFTLKDVDGYEAKLKKKIIERVSSKLNKVPLEVAKHPIGIETRVEDVRNMLEDEGTDVHVVGIHGMGGLGKTTIAKAVYNDLTGGFNGASCFISNIRERSSQPNGLLALQKQFFHEIFKDRNIPLHDVEHGAALIRERAKRRRVLLILDDIDSVDQLDALAGGRDWFGAGSVIIITTRDEKVLRALNVKQNEIYKPEELNEDQSWELFILHAFKGEQPLEDYLQLSNEAVEAAGGLPLTLEVLGSLLTDDMDVEEWKDILRKLKRIPPSKVQERLKLSYDCLHYLEKQIFLDISCFFIGRGRENAMYMWEDSGWSPNTAIKVLFQRSLIKLDEGNQEFQMHDQIRDMGRAIVEDEGSWMPQKQSRLWIPLDSLDLLQRKAVPRTIDAEGIDISLYDEKFHGQCVSAHCFEEMPNLRYLNVEQVDFQGTSQCSPTSLKWLELHDCYFDSPPFDFNLEKLVILGLYYTNMCQVLREQLPRRSKAFEKLKVLVIQGIDEAITLDFIFAPCLEKLTVEECALTTIDESIGKLKSLTYLRIGHCDSLEKLPDSICGLSSLQVFHIISCSTISSLPERLGDLKSLMELKIYSASIKTIPESVGGLTKLCELSVISCLDLRALPDSICQLSSLRVLQLNRCFRLASLPEKLGDMASLRKLQLTLTGVVKMPVSIGQLIKLRELLMMSCRKLSRLPDSICQLSSLETLERVHQTFFCTRTTRRHGVAREA